MAGATGEAAARVLIDALDEPAFVVERQVVTVANSAAKDLVGKAIEGSDVRLAIRHPQALEFVLAEKSGDVDFTGVGSYGRPWRLSVRPLGNSALLVRLIDRSATEAAEKMRVDFVANASHELRTPLSAVLGYAESLKDEDLDRQTSSTFAATIQREAKRMFRIIEDLMSLSRIEADRYVAPADSIAIATVIESAVDSVRGNAENRGCEIDLEIAADLPAISGDFAQLVQVIDNLLSNAVRYGCATGGCKVRISARAEGEWIRVEVSDNGPGIPREHLPFITRRFYRVDEARSRDSGGTGLGLAIVKHIVERHRGTLEIDSAASKGTTVIVRLPIR